MPGQRRLRSIAFVCSLVTLTACDSPTDPSETLSVTRISQGIFSRFDTPQRLVVRSEASLLTAWANVFGGAAPPPEVDFSREMIIVVALGSRPTSGFLIAVEGASGTRETAIVTVRSLSASTTCVTVPAVTNPYDIVRLPRREEVRFVEQSGVQPCS